MENSEAAKTTKDALQISETTLQAKITQLERAKEKAEGVLKTNKKRLIARHVDTLKETLSEVNRLRSTVEAEKIAKSVNKAEINNDEIDKWNNDVETKMEEADGVIEMLEEWLEEQREKTEIWQRDQKTERENQEREERLQFEMKLHETKVKLQAELTKPDAPQVTNETLKTQAKLRKLQITKFNGTYADWPRFWNLYSETIDKSCVSPVSKFSYLRELLCEKAKKSVEALPHNTEGYNRAISILKDRFGKESEIVKTYVKEILDLPHIATANVKRIHEFFEKLAYCVQSLETLKHLDAVNGTVSMILDKLPVIRGDLVRQDPNWESWNFIQFTEALKLWTRRNPVEDVKPEDPSKKRERQNRGYYQTQQKKGRQPEKPRACVYCNEDNHRSSECTKITTAEERKDILAAKKLCFNCTGAAHRASECRSTATCRNCNKRHHTSICGESKQPKTEGVMTAHRQEDQEVIYPIVLVEIDGIKTHALLDTGAGSSYASAKLIDALKKRPKQVMTRRVDMMLSSTTTKVEIYSANLAAVDGKFNMEIELSKVHKPQLMTTNNPNYKNILEKYNYLKGVKIDDPDDRKQIPIHVVLGASEYAAVKTRTPQKVGLAGQPVAEKTLLGWTIMSPGREVEGNPVLVTQSTTTDYEQLCALDVLGLADTHEDDQQAVHEEFKEQLERDETGWYQTKLPWKGNHPTLPTNETNSKKRLDQLIRKLKKNEQYEEYDGIIQDQLQQGIIETAPKEPSGKEFYIPHKGVTKKEAESTKLRIVYDASARENNNQPSLNDCLHPGPPLQNQLWDILVKSRFYPILLTGDLKKAFLQIRIKQEERTLYAFIGKSQIAMKLKSIGLREHYSASHRHHFFSQEF